MKTFLQNTAATAARLSQALRPTPARVHNASLLAGIVLVSAGADQAFGRPAGLMVAGGLVLAFTLLERVLLFIRSRG